MGLLNYSTKIPADVTAGEVQRILARHGAKAVMISYDQNGSAESLTFQVKNGSLSLGFSLPIEPDAVLGVLEDQYNKGQLRRNQPRPNREQAVKVAWRILKDWVEAQMAILETRMVTMEQIFLPYMVIRDNKTVYELMVEQGFYLPEGRG